MTKQFSLKPSLAATAGLLSFAYSAAAYPISIPKGFTPLFNGKDLTGWYGSSIPGPNELWSTTLADQTKYKKGSIPGGLLDKKGDPRTDHINVHWKVEESELVNNGQGLYLTTDKDYGDFELRLEYKTPHKGNSGIYLRGVPLVQIWDSTDGDTHGLGLEKGSGGLFNNTKSVPGKDSSKKMEHPFGEWNALRVTIIGERVTINFNGETVVDYAVLVNFGNDNYFSPGRSNCRRGELLR